MLLLQVLQLPSTVCLPQLLFSDYASRNPYLQQLGQSYLSLLVINLVGSILIPGISLAGHVGGAVGGALLAIVFPVRGERKIYSPGQRGLATLAFIALSALLLFIGLF